MEVAIGSGNNFSFYRRDIELTGLDFSHEMLKAAQKEAKKYPFKVTLIQNDVEKVEFNKNSFDTIISSCSLCAYQDPVTVLNNFREWCKPEGEILMMEHGLSTNKLLAGLQKTLDPLALKAVGCHQNRNISDYVNQSRLKLVKEERYLAGCLYLIWAKP
ncbi:class I SAM-dependent methyltransferase [Bacillus sp. JCM 19034]|uniref:class I SAM-dependent methyltransferase n=1 Tax=Bacillus sp. JCM 19034 TaxID=1481928 RepID=UPI000A76660C